MGPLQFVCYQFKSIHSGLLFVLILLAEPFQTPASQTCQLKKTLVISQVFPLEFQKRHSTASQTVLQSAELLE